MAIWTVVTDFLAKIFTPAAKLIDELVTTDEEKLSLKNELAKIQSEVSVKILEYETRLLEARSDVVRSEATGHSWLQRNWRPILMVLFGLLITLRWLGLLPVIPEYAEKAMWDVVKLGIGGYVIGRSVEKAAPNIVKMISLRKNMNNDLGEMK